MYEVLGLANYLAEVQWTENEDSPNLYVHERSCQAGLWSALVLEWVANVAPHLLRGGAGFTRYSPLMETTQNEACSSPVWNLLMPLPCLLLCFDFWPYGTISRVCRLLTLQREVSFPYPNLRLSPSECTAFSFHKRIRLYIAVNLTSSKPCIGKNFPLNRIAESFHRAYNYRANTRNRFFERQRPFLFFFCGIFSSTDVL